MANDFRTEDHDGCYGGVCTALHGPSCDGYGAPLYPADPTPDTDEESQDDQLLLDDGDPAVQAIFGEPDVDSMLAYYWSR